MKFIDSASDLNKIGRRGEVVMARVSHWLGGERGQFVCNVAAIQGFLRSPLE